MGIEADYDYTPRMYRRVVFAAVQNPSFQEASAALAELSEVTLLPKRIWRAAKRIGEERIAECRAAAQKYAALDLPAQQQSPLTPAPQLVCVQMDGGRYQRRDREVEDKSGADPTEDASSHWREFKAGCLLTMTSQTYAADPCPQLPPSFADPGKMRRIAREIKGFTQQHEDGDPLEKAEDALDEDRAGRPEVLVKSVVATTAKVHSFGELLAGAAYERGLNAAPRKAFVADGAEANWGVHQRHFSHYTPILDFVHALMYVYAAAMCQGEAAGWIRYRDWAQWLWSGEVTRVIAALIQWQTELGLPDQKETGTSRAQVAETLGYLRHHAQRMKYDDYRRQGLPITSSHIESTVKQINRRMKGTEKFWSDADPLLHLVADRLSQTNVTTDYWRRRTNRLAHCYHQPI